MSGPKGVSYRVVVPVYDAEQDRRDQLAVWRAVRTEAGEVDAEARALGLPALGLSATGPAGDAAAVRAETARLRELVTANRPRVAAAWAAQRRERIGLSDADRRAGDAAAESARREREAADAEAVRSLAERKAKAQQQQRGVVAAEQKPAPAQPERAFDKAAYRGEVAAALDRLEPDDPDLTALAAACLKAGEVEHARMYLSDLKSRIAKANKAHRATTEARARFRMTQERAAGRGVGTADLKAAEAALARGDLGAVDARLQAVEQALSQSDSAGQEERNRAYVLASVHDVLRGLGYGTVDVGIAEPVEGGLIVRRGTSDLAVRVMDEGDELDIRTVRLAGERERDAERAADDALCADLPKVLAGLRRAGIEPGRIRRRPAGLVPAAVVGRASGGWVAATPATTEATRATRTKKRTERREHDA